MKNTGDGKNVHAGHRERMRYRFRKMQGDDFAPHELLEMLLYYTISRKNTNELAHSLMRNFKTLPEMFMNSSYDDFIHVKGIGVETAQMLAIIAAAFRSDKAVDRKDVFLRTKEEQCAYFIQKIKRENCHNEVIIAACLSETMQMMCCKVLETGSADHASVSVGKLAKFVFQANCSKVILAHNHLNGIAKPSYEDVVETRKLFNLLASLEIELVDHIVISGEEAYSMAEHHDF